MPDRKLRDSVVIHLGAALGKALAKSLIPGTKLASIAADTLGGVLSAGLSDELACRRGEREFAALGEKVAATLWPTVEASGLDSGGKEAVVIGVAETISAADLSAEVIAGMDLQPTSVAQRLREASSRSRVGLSEKEEKLFDDLLEVAASRIVGVSSRIPRFTEEVFSEVLRRESEILALASEVLEELKDFRRESGRRAGSDRLAAWEADYRLGVVNQLGQLQLFGLDVTGHNRVQDLDIAYVPLAVVGEDGGQDGDVRGLVGDVFPGRRLVALVGEPGSGKTTLLRWFAVNAARRTFRDGLSEWNRLTPLYVALRSFVDRPLPALDAIPSALLPALEAPESWANDLVRGSGDRPALVLIDGVDELPVSQREHFSRWLSDLIRVAGPDSKIVMSSRPAGYLVGFRPPTGFGILELQPLEGEQIEALVHRWFRAAAGGGNADPEMLAQAEDDAATLTQGIVNNPPLRNLAATPLLAAALCALGRQRQQELPRDRIELYTACADMLLERRAREQHLKVEDADYPSLTLLQKLDLLERIAYWMLRNGRSQARVAQVESQVQAYLAVLRDPPPGTTPESVRRLLTERSGLLREVTPGVVDFAHRTFQEFLAAKAILDADDVDSLVGHALDPHWRETIVLTAARAPLDTRNRLITQLLDGAEEHPENSAALVLLAFGCLESSRTHDTELTDRLMSGVEELIPPANQGEARSLAAAGNAIVPFLAYERVSGAKVESVRASVRALAMLRTPEAMNALADYVVDTRKSVWEELFRCWDSFDLEGYGWRVSSNIPFDRLEVAKRDFRKLPFLRAARSLDIDRVDPVERRLRGIEWPELRALSVGEWVGEDLADLAGAQRLRTLEIPSARSLSSLDGLEALNLEQLVLGNLQQLVTISRLASQGNLRELVLAKAESVSSFDVLNGLTLLERLHLEFCRLLNGLEGVIGAELKSLELVNCPRLEDLSGLGQQPRLGHFSAAGSRQLKSIADLETASSLKSCDLRDCRSLKSVAALRGAVELEALHLVDCYYVKDVAEVVPTVQLKTLNLGGLPFVDSLTFIDGQHRLEELRLSRLARLKNWMDWHPPASLRTVVLDQITGPVSLKVFANCQSLRHVTVRGSTITSLEPVLGLENLRELDIQGSCVLDETSISSAKKRSRVDCGLFFRDHDGASWPWADA